MSSEIDELVDRIDGIDQGGVSQDDNTRIRLICAAQALIARLETPWDFIQRLTWQEVADDVKLFKHLGMHGSALKSIEYLAAKTSTEPALLKRIARHLAARNVLISSAAAPDSYGATHITEALATDDGSSGIRHACDVSFSVFLDMPEFLKANRYKTPIDSRNGVFQQRHGLQGRTKFECFQRPEYKHLNDDYNKLMYYTTKGRPSFLDVCGVASLLQQRPATLESCEYLLVDIGGGTGSDAAEFRTRFADAHGVVELQDLPGAIESARTAGIEDRGVSLRVHDFFNAQPVKGSRFYFMGSVLHDWPDEDCLDILKNIRIAMTPGYSTLLLSENVLPNANCHPHLSAIDLTMMAMLAGKERSEKDWQELLRRGGLKIIKVHTIPSCLKSVLQCERVS